MAISELRRAKRPPRLWVTLLVTLALLAATDVLLGAWSALPARLPAHFSSRYFERYATSERLADRPVVVLGDSVLWGYRSAAEDSVVAALQRRFPKLRFVNLAWQAQTPVNSDFVMRYLAARGIHPGAVLIDLNTLSFNQTAQEYDTLNGSLASIAEPALLEPFDDGRLSLDAESARPSLERRLERFVEDHWLLYGVRVDIHQALFGDADLASAASQFLSARATANAPAPELDPQQYAFAYDLTPLGGGNVSYAYTQHLFAMLAAEHVPALAFLNPVNHALVHAYTDAPAYDANLARLQALGRRYRVPVLNLDRLLPQRYFFDNTHLTPAGNALLATALAPHLARVSRVL